MSGAISSKRIAEFLQCAHCGNELTIGGVSTLSAPRAGTLIFAKRYSPDAVALIERSGAFAIVAMDFAGQLGPAATYVAVPNPRLAFSRVVSEFFAPQRPLAGVHPTAIVEDGAVLGEGVHIGPYCTVGGQSVIGDRTVLHPRVTLAGRTVIGVDCEVRPGATLGLPGFSFDRDEEGRPIQVPHLGGVRVGDRVRIGANTVIDCGTIGDTVLEDDVKIDDLVQVSHNSIIRRGAYVISGTIVCGGVEVGEDAWIAPHSTIHEQRHVGAGSVVGMGAVVLKDVPACSTVVGNPARILKRNA